MSGDELIKKMRVTIVNSIGLDRCKELTNAQIDEVELLLLKIAKIVNVANKNREVL